MMAMAMTTVASVTATVTNGRSGDSDIGSSDISSGGDGDGGGASHDGGGVGVTAQAPPAAAGPYSWPVRRIILVSLVSCARIPWYRIIKTILACWTTNCGPKKAVYF